VANAPSDEMKFIHQSPWMTLKVTDNQYGQLS